jgi:hypothetical protein
MALVEDFCPKIKNAIDGIRDISVRQNCVVRDTNMDLMIKIIMENPGDLPKYLNHPLHRQLIAQMDDQVSGRMTFDCKEAKEEVDYDKRNFINI